MPNIKVEQICDILQGLFKDKHSKKLKFPTLFYGHPRYFS